MSVIVYGTNKVTKEVVVIESLPNELLAMSFCEQWGWSYDDESGSYYLGL